MRVTTGAREQILLFFFYFIVVAVLLLLLLSDLINFSLVSWPSWFDSFGQHLR